jgi:hypothetical protein
MPRGPQTLSEGGFCLKKYAWLGVLLVLCLVTPVFAANGAPSGAHYNLNIIGVAKDKTADMTDTSRHTIFVPLEGKTAIKLAEGEFQVLDGNGTDGQASFQLPNPDPDNDGVTVYSVFARGLGKPYKSATIQPYMVDEDGIEWYSLGMVEVERTKGKPVFENVTRDLLYVWVDIDGDGDVDRIPLFSLDGYEYFWEYDNSGLKLCQLRFYEVETNVNPQ